VPRGRVIATDLRADYLAVAAERARKAGVRNLEVRVVERAAPGLSPHSVDLALLCQVDHGLIDRAAYFAAVAEALRPGGRIALVNYVRYREMDETALTDAHFRIVHEWTPSRPFFLLVAERASP
jgi:SAM-dependent methyltransferase